MQRKSIRKPTTIAKIYITSDFPELRNHHRYPTVIQHPETISLPSASTFSKHGRMLTDSPISNLPMIPDSNSIISLKDLDRCPLTEVASWSPTEMLPGQCMHSENPSVNYFFERAFDSSQKQEYQAAIKLYRKVIACEPNHFESWINIGICMMKQQMHSEAIHSFDSAIKANKSSFIPYYNKALDFILVHDFTSALQCMDMASLQFPDPPAELQKLRTYAIFKSGKVSSAISNREDAESPVSTFKYTRALSPAVQRVAERPKLDPRRMTMPLESSREVRHLYEPKKLLDNFKEIQEIDTRSIKTALSPPENKQKQGASQSMSPLRGSTRTKAKPKKPYDWKKYQLQEFFQPSKIMELPIASMEANIGKSRDTILENRIQDKLRTMEDKLWQYISKSIIKNYAKPEYTHATEFTEKEIGYLLEIFQDSAERFEEIDRILKESVFFSQHSVGDRRKIYEISEIRKVEKEERIFTQGNSANYFYSLLKGRVESVVDVEKAEVNSTTDFLKYSRTITGGGRIMLHEEYQANCTATETCYLLKIPTKEYQVILSELLKKKIEERVCFMTNLPLFKGLDPLMLIPMAWHVKEEKYYEGQIVIKKNEIPKGLVIIYKGYCGIYTTGHTVRNRLGSEYANIKIRKPKPPSFYTGNLTIKMHKDTKASGKSRKKAALSYKTTEKMEHGLMQFGDYFGGRVLLDQKSSENESKFTIIAESKLVEVLVVTKSTLQYLQEKIATHLKMVLQKNTDLDCPPELDSSQMDVDLLNWQKYKTNVIENIQRNSYVTKKKIEFPYLR